MNIGVRRLFYNKLLVNTIVILSSLLLFEACLNHSATNEPLSAQDTIVEKNSNSVSDFTTETTSTQVIATVKTTDKEYRARYICPNHCKNSGSDKIGDCADCGMELIENPVKTTK